MSKFKLHLLIEEKKWPTALLFLQDSDAIPSTRLPYKENLPLHMACDRKAPDEFILALLRANEEAAQWPGQNGNLPLHIAAQRDLGFDAIDALIRAFPQALEYRNASNFTPRDYGEVDSQVFQALSRPTCCWVELIEEEAREENQDRTVLDMHKRVDKAIAFIVDTNKSYNKLLEQATTLEKKFQDFSKIQSPELVERVSGIQKNLKEKCERIRTASLILEENFEVADARNSIAALATSVRQRGVESIQKSSVEELINLREKVESVKQSIASQRVALSE
mmetsp:Transcript_20736/g.29562  ORF Transcript_20736/g.29562 Transcript_20736/m.29562 type:complete len:279 (+) Transcript_20736:51-887(+)